MKTSLSADISSISTDKEVFNKVLNMAVKKAIQLAESSIRPGTVKDTLLAIPNVITAQIQQQSYITDAVNRFYSENQDLVEVKHTVGTIAESIAAEHPEYDIETLFKEAAKSTRKMLRLPEGKAASGAEEEFKNPAFAANSGRRQSPKKVSELQSQLDEL